MPPLISCVVPNLNYGRYIGAAINSIRAQTYGPIEIIVVDGGSTDDTLAIIAGHGEAVRVEYQAERSAPASRNTGILAAQGEFVAFLDADDLWHPEKLARQMARFTARPELGLCLTHVQNFWDAEAQETGKHFRNHRRGQPMPGYATISMLARRELFDTVGLLNTSLLTSDAADWIVRALDQGVLMEVLPDLLVSRRLHGANLTLRNVAGQRREWARFLKARLDRRRRGLPTADLPGFQPPQLPSDA